MKHHRRKTPAKMKAKPRKQASAPTPAASDAPDFSRHVEWGHFPRIRVRTYDDRGQACYRWRNDPRFRLPKGAIIADTYKQNGGLSQRDYYLDRKLRCRDCGCDFVFTAREQRYWYEELGFHISAEAVRCAGCRSRRRKSNALDARFGQAVRAWTQRPDDAEACAEFIAAAVERHHADGPVDWDRVMHAARSLDRLAPHRVDAGYYRALAEFHRRRYTQAAAELDAFMTQAKRRSEFADRYADARKLRKQLSPKINP